MKDDSSDSKQTTKDSHHQSADHDRQPKDKESRPRGGRRPREKSNAAASTTHNHHNSSTSSRKRPKLDSHALGADGSHDPPVVTAAGIVAAPAPVPANPYPDHHTAPSLSHQHHYPPQQQPPTPPMHAQQSPYAQAPAAAPLAHHSYQAYPPYSNLPPASHVLSQSQRPRSHPPPSHAPGHHPQSTPADTPRTSGRHYDPIRSAFENADPPPPVAHTQAAAYGQPARVDSPRMPYRASASPAIASIIDPPLALPPPAQSHQPTPQPAYAQLPHSSPAVSSALSAPPATAGDTARSQPALAPSPLPAPSANGSAAVSQPVQCHPPSTASARPDDHTASPSQAATTRPTKTDVRSRQSPPVAMDVDSDVPKPTPTAGKKEKDAGTGPTSTAPSPKPAKPVKEPASMPQGSGLISTALFGGVADVANGPTRSVPDIILHIPLKGTSNQIINFARLAEEQYGFAALHPRLAAHRERMARIAAAGAALERSDRAAKGLSAGESADEDLSLDVDRDSDLDGDISMGGGGMGTNGADTDTADGKKKRRKKKVEEYDRDDPFVDDSELAWQEQAAASKDGFFVYSGPLVPEGEKVQVERADGTIKRGRGRGRGSGRARGAPTPHVPIKSAAAATAAIPISQETGLPLRGPGSRGGNPNRRPRAPRVRPTAESGDKEQRAGSSGRGGGGPGSRGGKTHANANAHSHTHTHTSAPNGMTELAPAPSQSSTAHGSNSLNGQELPMMMK